MEGIKELIAALNSLTPLGLAGALAYIIYLQVKSKKAVREVSHNHLSGLPGMQADIRTMTQQLMTIVPLLQAINNNIIYVKARVNGRDTSTD